MHRDRNRDPSTLDEIDIIDDVLFAGTTGGGLKPSGLGCSRRHASRACATRGRGRGNQRQLLARACRNSIASRAQLKSARSMLLIDRVCQAQTLNYTNHQVRFRETPGDPNCDWAGMGVSLMQRCRRSFHALDRVMNHESSQSGTGSGCGGRAANPRARFV